MDDRRPPPDRSASPRASLRSIGGAIELGQALHEMRRVAHLDRRALAAAADVHPTTIAIIEHGQRENPPLVLVAAFSRAFKVSIKALTDPFVLPLARTTLDTHPAALNPPLPPNVLPIDRNNSTGAEGMGRMLRTLRKDQRLSITRVTTLCDLSPTTISAFERGLTHNPGLLNLTRLMRVITDDAHFLSLAEGVGLAAQVFAEEISSFEAIRRYRQRSAATSHRSTPSARIAALPGIGR